MRPLALGLCLLAGCSGQPPTLDQELELAFSQQATIESSALTLTFTERNEDSRCPQGVQCVWAGQATVTIEAVKEGASPQALVLTIPSPSSATYLGYSVTLLALDPYPEAGRQIALEEYVATLVVTKQ